MTPARRLFDWSKLIQVRRILGLPPSPTTLLHFIYIVDSRLDLGFVAREIVLRIYLTIGFAALLGLLILGLTSTDGMIKRLGAVRWNRLHRIIYVITPLAILHYYLQSKVDVTQPVLMSGFFFWLMGYRIMAARGIKEGLVPLLLLAVAAALLTVAVEAAWYGSVGIGARRVLRQSRLPSRSGRPGGCSPRASPSPPPRRPQAFRRAPPAGPPHRSGLIRNDARDKACYGIGHSTGVPMRKMAFVVLAGVALTGCANWPTSNPTTNGVIIGGTTGAVAGGLATGNLGGAVAGGVIGAAAGGIIGASTGGIR